MIRLFVFKVLPFTAILAFATIGYCQTKVLTKSNLGFGIGLNYGGIGVHYAYSPSTKVNVFAGVGYNLDLVGYNLGLDFVFYSKRRIKWYITGMYGYNAVMKVEIDAESYRNKTYYGPTLGTGIDLTMKLNQYKYWSFQLLLPIRPKAYHDTIDALKMLGYEVREPLPIGISIGYHFVLK